MIKKFLVRFLLGVIILVVFAPVVSFCFSALATIFYVIFLIAAMVAVVTMVVYILYSIFKGVNHGRR